MINILECSCLVMPALSLIKKFVDVVKIAVPIILIIFGMIELGRAMVSPDEAAMKKAQGSFIKKLIAAVCVFLIPTVLNIVTGIIAKGTNDEVDTGNWASCWDNAETLANGCNQGNSSDNSSNNSSVDNNSNKKCYVCYDGNHYWGVNNLPPDICVTVDNITSKEQCLAFNG